MKTLTDDSADIELLEFVMEALEGVDLPAGGLLIEVLHGPEGEFPSFEVHVLGE